MLGYRILHIIVAIVMLLPTVVVAQRKASPVSEQATKINTVERKRAAQKLIDKHVRPSMIFSDSVIDLDEFTRKDTTLGPRFHYPKLYSASVGLNIWDPLMRIAGADYGLFGVTGEVSFHNRLQANAELGLGKASTTPDGMNYTYNTPMSVYGKLGGSYNFMYNDDSDYRFHFGMMLGFSAFKYSVTDVSAVSDYWGESTTFNINDIKSHAVWTEFLVGLRVKVVGPVYMGWDIRYRFMLNCKGGVNGQPWYVPGYGSRTQRIGGAFTVSYVLPLGGKHTLKKSPELENLEKKR